MTKQKIVRSKNKFQTQVNGVMSGNSGQDTTKTIILNDNEENNSDDEEVNALVQNSLKLLRKPSKEMLSQEQFANLSKNIINNRLPFSSGIENAKTNEASKELNKRQLESGVYDESSLLAPPLKHIKIKARPTAGKGWFDFEV